MGGAAGRAGAGDTPGRPAAVIGWDAVPAAGSPFTTHETRDEAEAAAETLADAEKKFVHSTVEAAADAATLGIVIRADYLGSADAIEHELAKLTTDRVRPLVLARDTGDISEADVKRAAATPGSAVVGF